MLTACSITHSVLLSFNLFVFFLHFQPLAFCPYQLLSPSLPLSVPEKARQGEKMSHSHCCYFLSLSLALFLVSYLHQNDQKICLPLSTSLQFSPQDDKKSDFLSLSLAKSHPSTHSIYCRLISFSWMWPNLELTGKDCSACQAKPSHNKPVVALRETRDQNKTNKRSLSFSFSSTTVLKLCLLLLNKHSSFKEQIKNDLWHLFVQFRCWLAYFSKELANKSGLGVQTCSSK